MSILASGWSPTERELRDALRRDAFTLHYQPIYGSDDLELVAYESLVRWLHPVQGMVPPLRFIAVAEQNGLIHELGLWVLRRACRDLATLKTRYVGINVSAVQLRSPGFASDFNRIVEEEHVSAAEITVEITESVALEDGGVERRNLAALRDGGSYLAIDDFGTGFASYDYINKFPFNVLKIDKSFIDQIDTSQQARSLVAGICEIGRTRNIVIVAEGVETQKQFDILRELGCPRVQGYLLGRPAPATALDPPIEPRGVFPALGRLEASTLSGRPAGV